MSSCARQVAVFAMVAVCVLAVEDSAMVEMLADPEAVEASSFTEVKGFELKEGGTEVNGKTQAECEALCLADSTCKSYSFDATPPAVGGTVTPQCYYTKEALNFDPAFVMKVKALNSQDPTKKWRVFEGLTYTADGWTKLQDQSLSECETKCTAAATCMALSWREEDRLCLLSPKGLDYASSPTMAYHEKKGVVKSTMPLTSEGGVTSAAAVTDPGPTTAERETAALLAAETKKLADAEKEKVQAETMIKESNAAVAAETTQSETEVAKATTDAKAQLSKEEADFSEKEGKTMAAKTETLKMEMASASLEQQALTTEEKAKKEEDEASQAAADAKQEAIDKAAAAVASGATSAAQLVERTELQETANQAAQQLNDANEKTSKAKIEQQDATDSVAATQESTQKATTAADIANGQQTAAITSQQTAAEINSKQDVKKAETAAANEGNAQLQNIENAQAREEASNEANAAAEGAADEKNNKKTLKSEQDNIATAEANKAVQDQNLQTMQTEATQAQVEANAVASQTQLAGEEAKVKEAKAVSDANIEFQKQELAESIKSNLATEAVTEVQAQQEQIAREAAQQVAMAGKSEAEKLAQAAKDTASEKKAKEEGKINQLEKQVAAEKEAEVAKTAAEKKEIEDKLASEKAAADKEAKRITDGGVRVAGDIEAKAKADADAKIEQAQADAAVLDAAAKEKGEQQASDIAVAAEQAALVNILKINADVTTFVSSGLNPGTQSYQQLMANAQEASDQAASLAKKASASTQAADAAASAMTAAENAGKELATKSSQPAAVATNIVGSATASSAAAAVEAGATAGAAQAAVENVISSAGSQGRRLLDTELHLARTRAMKVQSYLKRRLLQAATPAPSPAGATPAPAGTPANELASKTTAAANSGATEVSNKELQNKATTKSAEATAKATSEAAAQKSQTAAAAAQSNQAALNAANLLPANTAYGKLPEMHAHSKYLRIQSGGPMEQSAFIKIPTNTIPPTVSVIGASLRMYKTGGGGGPAIVKLASCSWSRNTLTYTASENLPQGTVSEGVSAIFPEESDIWTTLKLKPAMIQAAKANGDHICFEVTGGPKDEPAIVSSELTSQPPQLKLEVQSLPKTEAQKESAAKAKAVIEAKVAREKAVELHLYGAAVSELTAKQLQKKGVTLTTTIATIRSEYAAKDAAQTTGAAFNTLKSTNDVARNAAIDAKITTGTATITGEENSKMTTALTDSGLSGNARINLEAALTTTKEAEIKTRVAAMTTKATEDTTLQFTKQLADDITAIKAGITKEETDDVNAATQDASTMTDAEKALMATSASGVVSKKMADWRAGNLKVNLPDPAAIAAAKAADGMSGLTEDQRAALNSKVADQVATALPAKLTAAVEAKMMTAQNEAILAIQNEMKTESDTKLASDIATQSQGKTDDEITALKASLNAAASTALDIKITEKTTGTALSGLKTQLQTDLTTQLTPAVKADLKASIMQSELAKAKVAAAQTAVATGGTELGSALDNASTFNGK